MSMIGEITESVYADLLARCLPRPIHSRAEHHRLTQVLLELDERDELSLEEEALAEVLTLLIEDYERKYHPFPQVSPRGVVKRPHGRAGTEAQRHLADPRQQGCRDGSPERPALHQ
jgi:hypothetical protein